MPTLDRVTQLHKELTAEALGLVERKGRDYNREKQQTGNTLFNLEVASLLGLVDSPQASILVRLCDKFMRLISLRNPTSEAAVKEESVRDTVRDAINYLVYYYAEWEAANMENFAKS